MIEQNRSPRNAPPLSSKSSVKEPLIVAALIVATSVGLAVGGIVFKTKDSLKKERVELMADANAKQVAPLRRVVQGRLQQDRVRLIQFAATRATLGPGRARAFGDFAMVAMVVPERSDQWTVRWTEKGPLYPSLQSGQNMLTVEQEITLLRSLPYDRIREGDVHWQRLSDANGRPLWSMAVAVETESAPSGTTPANASLPEGTDYQSVQVGTGGKAVVVGFFGRNPLSAATEDFIGSTSTAFVVDSRGYAASHSIKAMIGALLKDDPSVKEVFSARSSAGATRYNNDQGTIVFSAFEQVDRSNLYVVMATPDVVAGVSSKGFGQTAILTGVLAFIVGLVLVVAWGGRLIPRVTSVSSSESEPRLIASDFAHDQSRTRAARIGLPEEGKVELELPQEFTKPISQTSVGYSQKANDERKAVTSANAKERSDYVKSMVEGLERSMREPLLASLANIQLLKAKAGENPSPELMQEMVEHIASVDRDLRHAKELIDTLSKLSTTTQIHSDSDRQNIQLALKDAIAAVKAKIEGEGVVFDLRLDPIPNVSGREEFTKQAVSEILENARRALTGRSGKNIKVRLEDKGESVMLSISDNGIGMTRDLRTKAFEPFVREFSNPEAKGLGLSFVRLVIQASGGTAELVSSPGEGTTVVIRWPITAADRREFEQAEATRRSAVRDSEHLGELTRTRETNIDNSEDSVVQKNANVSLITKSAFETGIDLGSEGQNQFGGRAPISGTGLQELPPPPKAGGIESGDSDDENWTFDSKTPTPDATTKISETAVVRSQEPTEIVIRPVKRE